VLLVDEDAIARAMIFAQRRDKVLLEGQAPHQSRSRSIRVVHRSGADRTRRNRRQCRSGRDRPVGGKAMHVPILNEVKLASA
jgi:hypothetical protein